MLRMDARDFLGYWTLCAERIAASGDYITSLDARTGDGDHWININMGFQALMREKAALEALELPALLKKAARIFMASVGGSSGVLYGSAYLAAGKACEGIEALDDEGLAAMLGVWLEAMMKRGGARPGDKTMLDALAPAANAYQGALARGADSAGALAELRRGALEGAEDTRRMRAVKGRACYQEDKGLGHLDPGAVTMAMQLECLAQYAAQNCINQ